MTETAMISLLRQKDKQKHFFVGALLGFVSFFLAVIGAFYKEIKDARSGGYFDKNDLFATLIGGSIGQSFSLILWWILKSKFA